jgi:nucleoside-diphosphate-sugar epimerase
MELLRSVCLAADRDVEPLYGPPRSADIRHSQADVSVARQALGFEARVPLADAIARTLQWFVAGSSPSESAGYGSSRHDQETR